MRAAILVWVVRGSLSNKLTLKQGPEEVKEQASGYLKKQCQAEGMAIVNTVIWEHAWQSVFDSFHLEAFLNTLES